MIDQLEHIGVMVEDMDRSVRFYTEVLGLSLVERRHFNTVELAFIKVGETELELVAGSRGYAREDAVVNHIAFRVHDLDAAMTRLREEGVAFMTPEPVPVWEGMRVIFFRGPDGEKLELFERKAERNAS
jgi:lactoylglutathione lyase